MSEQRELPKYKSHKIIQALKIDFIGMEHGKDNPHRGKGLIHPVDEGYAPFHVSEEYMKKHSPKAGGYYVRYPDGYESWSPAKAFEDGYTRL